MRYILYLLSLLETPHFNIEQKSKILCWATGPVPSNIIVPSASVSFLFLQLLFLSVCSNITFSVQLALIIPFKMTTPLFPSSLMFLHGH